MELELGDLRRGSAANLVSHAVLSIHFFWGDVVAFGLQSSRPRTSFTPFALFMGS
jgi:hypothetical protein